MQSKDRAGVSQEKLGKPDLRSIDLADLDEVAAAAEAVAAADAAEWEEERQRRFGISGVNLNALQFSMDSEGREKGLLMNRTNAATILKTAVATRRMLGYDEFAKTMVLWHAVPEAFHDEEYGLMQTDPPLLDKPIDYQDEHTGKIQEWMQRVGRLRQCSDQLAYQAAESAANENHYHPVRDYLSGVNWDGVPRVRTCLTDAFAVEDTEYSRRAAEIFFVSAVKRIFDPGCKSDYMLILEGPQGYYKSTFFAILTGEDYFSDSLGGNVDTKDAMQHLQGKWIIEFAELTSIKRSDVEAMKQFISRRVEKYRPPYGRKEVKEKRQCIFVGTTNESGYMKDTTGNRRFLPVLVRKRLDEVWLREMRDQLWAEAVQMLRDGVTNWPDPEFEEKWMKPEQAARVDEDAWQDVIGTWLKVWDAKCKKKTYAAIAKGALQIEAVNVNALVKARIKNCMQGLGYQTVKIGGERLWEKKEDFAG